VLTIGTLSGLTLAALAEIDDGVLWRLHSVDHDLVNGVHRVPFTEVSIRHP